MVSCPDEVMSDDLKPAEPIIFVSADLDEELLAVAYIRMKVEGLLPIVYHESIPPLSEFIAYHNKEKKHSYYDHYLGAFARPTLDAPPELIGMGWLGGIRGPVGSIKGEVGFVFFRKWQQVKVPLVATRLMIDYCFDVAGVDIVVGTTPVKNRAALIFDRRLGFTQLPAIPNFTTFQGEPCDAVISYMTKPAWRDSNGTTAK